MRTTTLQSASNLSAFVAGQRFDDADSWRTELPRRWWWTYHAECIHSHSVHHLNNGSNEGSISRTGAQLCAVVTRRARRLEKSKSLSNHIYFDRDIFQPAFLLLVLIISFCLFLSLCFCFCCCSRFVLSLHKDLHPSVLLFSASIEACIFRNDAARGDAPLGLVGIIHHCMWRKSSKKRSFVIHHSQTHGQTHRHHVCNYI